MHDLESLASAALQAPRLTSSTSMGANVEAPNPIDSSNDSSSAFPLAKLLSESCSLSRLLEYDNFKKVPRVSAQPTANLLAEINQAEKDGTPIIVEGWHKLPSWDSDKFSLDWLLKNIGNEEVDVRNVHTKEDIKMPFQDYIKQSQKGLYAKDISCPPAWSDWLQNLPPEVQPLGNEDLLRLLPSKMRPENLMCYCGPEGTFTPAHKDLCASLGHNLMCHASGDAAAFWFLTETSSSDVASKYFQSLGQELDFESHFASVEELVHAPFPVFVCEQKIGDLVLIPARSCHQVFNYKGFTVKTSWSRMNLQSLQLAVNHELPIYHRVCRADVYRVKLLLSYCIKEWTTKLSSSQPVRPKPSRPARPPLDQKSRRILADLLKLFDDILAEEYAPPQYLPKKPTLLTGQFACDFCGADIFVSLFRCNSIPPCQPLAVTATRQSPVILCAMCYVEGRSCPCGGVMEAAQIRAFDELLGSRNQAARVLNVSELSEGNLPLPSRVFESACLLRNEKILKAKRGRRTTSILCSLPEPPHPADLILICPECNAGACFAHLLEIQVHSSQALLVHHASHTNWHNLHLKRRNPQNPTAKADPEMGTSTSRVLAASRYPSCRPLADDGRLLLGFYDQLWKPKQNSVTSPAFVEPAYLINQALPSRTKKRYAADLLHSPRQKQPKSDPPTSLRRSLSLERLPAKPTTHLALSHTKDVGLSPLSSDSPLSDAPSTEETDREDDHQNLNAVTVSRSIPESHSGPRGLKPIVLIPVSKRSLTRSFRATSSKTADTVSGLSMADLLTTHASKDTISTNVLPAPKVRVVTSSARPASTVSPAATPSAPRPISSQLRRPFGPSSKQRLQKGPLQSSSLSASTSLGPITPLVTPVANAGKISTLRRLPHFAKISPLSSEAPLFATASTVPSPSALSNVVSVSGAGGAPSSSSLLSGPDLALPPGYIQSLSAQITQERERRERLEKRLEETERRLHHTIERAAEQENQQATFKTRMLERIEKAEEDANSWHQRFEDVNRQLADSRRLRNEVLDIEERLRSDIEIYQRRRTYERDIDSGELSRPLPPNYIDGRHWPMLDPDFPDERDHHQGRYEPPYGETEPSGEISYHETSRSDPISPHYTRRPGYFETRLHTREQEGPSSRTEDPPWEPRVHHYRWEDYEPHPWNRQLSAHSHDDVLVPGSSQPEFNQPRFVAGHPESPPFRSLEAPPADVRSSGRRPQGRAARGGHGIRRGAGFGIGRLSDNGWRGRQAQPQSPERPESQKSQWPPGEVRK